MLVALCNLQLFYNDIIANLKQPRHVCLSRITQYVGGESTKNTNIVSHKKVLEKVLWRIMSNLQGRY